MAVLGGAADSYERGTPVVRCRTETKSMRSQGSGVSVQDFGFMAYGLELRDEDGIPRGREPPSSDSPL